MNDIQSQEQTKTINDIREILGILRKRKNIIIWTTVICAVLTLFTSVFIISPKYSSSTNILVNRKIDNQVNAQAQLQADVQMISTYKDIITSPNILDSVSTKLRSKGYNLNAEQIKKYISITNQQNSQVFTVTIKCGNPNEAAIIANTIAKTFKNKIKNIMSVNNVSILSKAQVNPNPVSPKIALNTLFGILMGLILGLVLVFIQNALDRTVTDESFITDELGLNELGIISEIPASKVKKLLSRSSRSLGRTESRNRRV